jgi:hypothetical protein
MDPAITIVGNSGVNGEVVTNAQSGNGTPSSGGGGENAGSMTSGPSAAGMNGIAGSSTGGLAGQNGRNTPSGNPMSG